jgi:hypothetical protein
MIAKSRAVVIQISNVGTKHYWEWVSIIVVVGWNASYELKVLFSKTFVLDKNSQRIKELIARLG